MTEHDQKLLGLGRMVYGMITDLAVLPPGDAAFGRKTITYPNAAGGKDAVEIILARKVVADAMEEAAAMRFAIVNVNTPKGDRVA